MKLKSILLFASAMLVISNSFAQLHVTTNGKKYVLLEEATGTWCGYCPDGAEDIERNIEPNYPRAIIASFHGPVAYGEPMTVTGDPFCTTTGYITSFPEATIDRATFGGVIGQQRPWESYIATDTGLAPHFDVSMKCTYDTTTKIITVIVTGKALVAGTGTWNINAYVTEDSVSSAGANGQGNYAHCGCSHDYTFSQNPPYDTSWFWHDGNGIAETNIPTAHYSHMNVVRSVLATTAAWGDLAFTNPAVGATFTKTYTYTVPSTSFSKYMKVIGIIQKFGSATTDRAIENAVQAKVRLMPVNALGVTQVSNAMMDVQVFPNPAKNYIAVRGMLENPSDTRIVIYDALGRVMVDRTYAAGGSLFGENISLTGFGNGTYFMNLTNAGETVTKQFVVNK